MNKSNLIKILIIILLIMGVVVYTQYSNQSKTIQVGEAYFTIPSGYSEGILNKDNDINLTNGTNSIFISDCEGNVNENVKVYVDAITNRNLTYNTTNYTFDNVSIVKVIVNNVDTTHYWFSFNGKTYTIYSWDNNNRLDAIVVELIKTIHT